MKKLLMMAAFFAASAGLFAGCNDDDNTDDEKPAIPAIALEGASIDQPQEMTQGMSVKVNVTVPGNVQDFTITIDSPFLTADILALAGLTTNISLAKPASTQVAEALKSFGLPVGSDVVGKTALTIDISRFVPMIMAYDQTSDHKFVLKVTDAKNQSVTKTLTLHLTEEAKAVPVITMEDADIDAVHEIVAGMKVKVNVAAPGRIADFAIKISSPVLNQELLGSLGLSTEMNLVTATGAMASGLTGLGFPVGDKVKDQPTLSFDISQLIPLIAQLPPQQTSDHNFELTVTDAKGQATTKTLKFHLTGVTDVTYNKDADLWANTASFTVKLAEAGTPTVEYKASTATDWHQAAVTANPDGTFKAFMGPKWVASKNEAGLDIHSIEAGTGIFAATTYNYRVLKGTETAAEGKFTTSAGDAIPNGDMSGWSKKIFIDDSNTEYPLTYPNPEGMTFWDSGNNFFLEQPDAGLSTPLCYGENGAAVLKPRMVFEVVFAPGNMFTGFFDYMGMSGMAKFGQPYTWTARPRALKVRYKATVDVIDQAGPNDPEADNYNGKQDRSCIFVAVVNWETQHGVTSGIFAPTGMWNPAEVASLDEGPILGYGQQIITESTSDWVELTIPVSWYDKAAVNPSSAKFSLVISCATSVRGDYLTGSTKNLMQVDDFQWVY